MSDLIDRKAILKKIENIRQGVQMMDDTRRASIIMNGMHLCEEAVRNQPSADTDLSDYSDRLWKNAYERGKAEGARIPSAEPDFSCDGCQTPKHICGICRRNYPNITDHYCTGEAWREAKDETAV